jgi:hypothetical protein
VLAKRLVAIAAVAKLRPTATEDLRACLRADISVGLNI